MEACQVILTHKEALYAAGAVAYAILECWLGKTDKLQAASVIELVLSPLFKKRSQEDQKP